MHAGDLSSAIVLKRKSVTRAALTGNETVTYVTVATVSAKAEPLRGREFMAARQEMSDIEVRFTLYYRTDVAADWRIEWRGKDYEIVGDPIDVGARKQWLEIMARTTQK